MLCLQVLQKLAVALPIGNAVQLVQAGIAATQAQGNCHSIDFITIAILRGEREGGYCSRLHPGVACSVGIALPSDELARLYNNLATAAIHTDVAVNVARLLQDCSDSRQVKQRYPGTCWFDGYYSIFQVALIIYVLLLAGCKVPPASLRPLCAAQQPKQQVGCKVQVCCCTTWRSSGWNASWCFVQA